MSGMPKILTAHGKYVYIVMPWRVLRASISKGTERVGFEPTDRWVNIGLPRVKRLQST